MQQLTLHIKQYTLSVYNSAINIVYQAIYYLLYITHAAINIAYQAIYYFLYI